MPEPSIRPAFDTPAGEAVLVFLRAPDRGKVKTRLARTIGPDAALVTVLDIPAPAALPAACAGLFALAARRRRAPI